MTEATAKGLLHINESQTFGRDYHFIFKAKNNDILMMKVNKNTLNAIRGFLTLSTQFMSEMMQQRSRKKTRTPIKYHRNLQMNTYF